MMRFKMSHFAHTTRVENMYLLRDALCSREINIINSGFSLE